MKLYHFTANHFVPEIKRSGLTLGMFPILDEHRNLVRMLDKWQWLTDERRPEEQSWATSEGLEYSRTETRLTIAIPKSHRHQLHKARDLPKYRWPFSESAWTIITEWPGSEHWYVYFGNVPSGWIREIEATA